MEGIIQASFPPSIPRESPVIPTSINNLLLVFHHIFSRRQVLHLPEKIYTRITRFLQHCTRKSNTS